MGVENPAPQQGRATPDRGDVDWPAPAASQPVAAELPDFAKKADDLEAIKGAVDDAASVSGALWFSYLFVLFYLAIAAGAVTHTDLFLENPVKLPFLGVELPLLVFFFIAPILFLVVHAYVLVHLVMLTDKAKRFHEELYKQLGEETGLSDEKAKNIRDGLRQLLPSNIFVQFLAGAPQASSGLFGWALRAIGWTTLVVGPVLLLLMMQIQFLPYHSRFVTWTQRVALVADLALVWWLWGRILSGREMDGRGRVRAGWGRALLGLVFSLGVVLFATLAATFPGEWEEDSLPGLRVFPKLAEPGDQAGQSKKQSFGDWIASYYDWFVKSEKISFHDWVFNSPVNNVTSRRKLPFSSTLVLPGLNIYESLHIDDPEKAKWHDFIFRARGRDLRSAIFDFGSLAKVDFEGAKLQGAKLAGTKLQGSSFQNAELQGATLVGARLQGAELTSAYLQGAYLNDAQLQGATLIRARLQGATLACVASSCRAPRARALMVLDREELLGAIDPEQDRLAAEARGA